MRIADAALVPFDYRPRTRVVFGEGAIAGVGGLAQELGGRKVLLVTDPGIVAAGHAERVTRLLEAAGLAVSCFDRAVENPTTRCVEECVDAARRASIDLIIGLGGGSSLDTAKGCNFILTNGGHMRDYWGVGKARHPMLPLIAIPTTGGTGSECQSFALITDETTHQKMACGDPKAAARVAILDPALTLSQPPRVTACTGIDAVAHALETAVTRKRTQSLRALFTGSLPVDGGRPAARDPGAGRSGSARLDVAGCRLGGHGHRKQHAWRGPLRRQPVDGPFRCRSRPRRGPDAPARGPIQCSRPARGQRV